MLKFGKHINFGLWWLCWTSMKNYIHAVVGCHPQFGIWSHPPETLRPAVPLEWSPFACGCLQDAAMIEEDSPDPLTLSILELDTTRLTPFQATESLNGSWWFKSAWWHMKAPQPYKFSYSISFLFDCECILYTLASLKLKRFYLCEYNSTYSCCFLPCEINNDASSCYCTIVGFLPLPHPPSTTFLCNRIMLQSFEFVSWS
jgi:hypothetical protein